MAKLRSFARVNHIPARLGIRRDQPRRSASSGFGITCSALSALSTLGITLSDDLWPALAFRTLGGVGLAGTYMPGLRALTQGCEGQRRSRIAAFSTSSFTTGTAVSFLLGRAGVLWGWRTAFVVSTIAGIVSLAIAWA